MVYLLILPLRPGRDGRSAGSAEAKAKLAVSP